MAFLSKLKSWLLFKETGRNFVSKNKIFQINFPNDNWEYRRSGNSYYYFVNDSLKGALDFSIIWGTRMNSQISNEEEYINYLFFEQEESLLEERIGNLTYKRSKYRVSESNLEFISWFFVKDDIFLHLRYYIFEEEIERIKLEMEKEVIGIMSTLRFNIEQFDYVVMR